MKQQLIIITIILLSYQSLIAISNIPVKWLVEPNYDYAESFSEDMALVVKDGKAGYINKKGEIAIKIQFDYATSQLSPFVNTRF